MTNKEEDVIIYDEVEIVIDDETGVIRTWWSKDYDYFTDQRCRKREGGAASIESAPHFVPCG